MKEKRKKIKKYLHDLIFLENTKNIVFIFFMHHEFNKNINVMET